MNMLKKPYLSVSLLLAAFLLVTACGRESGASASSVTFRFDSALDLKPGSRVVYLGTIVGQVAKAPEISPDGKYVTVRAELTDLPPHLLPQINQSMTAQIVRDDLITGGRQLKLHLSKRSDAPPLAADSVVFGMNNFLELEAWKALNTGDGNWLERPAGYIFNVDPEEVGTWIRYLNLGSFILLGIVFLTTLLHKFFGTLSRGAKPKSKPLFWRILFLVTSVRILGVAAVFAAAASGHPIRSFPPQVILPENPIVLLQWEWRPLLLSLSLLGLGVSHWVRSFFRKEDA